MPEVPVTQNDPLPLLEGFDTETALGRLAGNRTLYKTLLTRFLQNYRGADAGIRQSLEAGQLEEVQRNAHTIKGLAASMGNQQLSSVSADLEHLAADAQKDAARISGIPAALDIFARELDKAMNTLAAALGGQAEPAAKPAVQVDSAAVSAGLTRLEELLNANDAGADAAFSQIVDQLRSLDAGSAAALREAIQNFDFEAAVGLVRTLRGKLPR